LRASLRDDGLSLEDVAGTVDQALTLCQTYFTEIRSALTEREKELASLVQVLRDTLADLAGQAKSFNVDLMKTTDRINGLANIDDIKELKRRISSEARELKNVVVEKQRRDDVLFMQLSRRVDALQTQLAEAQKEAEEDPLTGAANRRGFDRALREWAATATRTKKPFLLAMVEIDRFKAITEKHGHQVADRVLLCVAQRLQHDCTDKDIVARFGAESFAVLMRGAELDAAAVQLKATVQALAALEYEYEQDGNSSTVSFTCCAGVTEFNAGETAEDIVKRADRARSDASRGGASQVVARKRGRFGFLNWAS
jgi:diguanylate cyclase